MLTVLITKNKQKPQKNVRKFWEVIDMFSTLIVVTVSQVHVYVQTHRDVYIKCVQFLALAGGAQ